MNLIQGIDLKEIVGDIKMMLLMQSLIKGFWKARLSYTDNCVLRGTELVTRTELRLQCLNSCGGDILNSCFPQPNPSLSSIAPNSSFSLPRPIHAQFISLTATATPPRRLHYAPTASTAG